MLRRLFAVAGVVGALTLGAAPVTPTVVAVTHYHNVVPNVTHYHN